MGRKSRRKFLQEACVVITGTVLGPSSLGEIRNIKPDAGATIHSPTHPGVSLLPAMGEADSSAPALPGKMRGLMVDAGRVPESMEYYRRVVEFCADWELNALQFRLADDQGSALRFASVPGLLMHKNAFTPDQLHSLAGYAQSHGVDLIPELESFGHTGFITRSPAYAHLLDRDARGSSEFTGVIPVNPEVHRLFQTLYREVAAIFPSAFLHGGCDEVNWGGSKLSQEALAHKTRAQIWAEYLNFLNQTAEGVGKQFIVWGDFVLHKEPEILGQLDKTTIIMDWNYRENSSARVGETLQKVRANGSRGIGAPGLINYTWGPRVGTEQLRNIDAFAESYLEENEPASLGVILTNWVPSRYIQNSIWDGFAYAAVAFNQRTATAQTSGFRRFVEKHYRAEWNEVWGEVFETIYAAAPCVPERSTASWMALPLQAPWSSDEELAAVLRDGLPRPNPFTRLRGLLVQLEPQVLKHLSDFQAFALCVEYLERLFWREAVLHEQAAGKPLDRETATLLIAGIADRDRALAVELSRDWDRGRFADSAVKVGPLYGFLPKDELLFQWTRAAEYSASLAGSPERFYPLLQAAKLM
jgi:Glycosyl hydrolase family 20, catalytic domain